MNRNDTGIDRNDTRMNRNDTGMDRNDKGIECNSSNDINSNQSRTETPKMCCSRYRQQYESCQERIRSWSCTYQSLFFFSGKVRVITYFPPMPRIARCVQFPNTHFGTTLVSISCYGFKQAPVSRYDLKSNRR